MCVLVQEVYIACKDLERLVLLYMGLVLGVLYRIPIAESVRFIDLIATTYLRALLVSEFEIFVPLDQLCVLI